MKYGIIIEIDERVKDDVIHQINLAGNLDGLSKIEQIAEVKSDVQYAAFMKNIETGKYEQIDKPYDMEFLCRSRAKEKIEAGLPYRFDPSTLTIKQRTVEYINTDWYDEEAFDV